MNGDRKMRLIRGDKKTEGPRVVVLGMFDGVHAGHRELILSARKEAETLGIPLQVCTFEPHPLRIIRPETAPRLLSTLGEKAALMQKLGVDELRVIHFTRAFAESEPEYFLKALKEKADPDVIYAGWNYTFGRGGLGDAELLRKVGDRIGFQARIHEPVRTADGLTISSSEIRRRLLAGRIPEANIMLGEAYPLSGKVVPGKHIGHTLGFPTANLRIPPEKLLPDFGVYLCRLSDGEKRYHGVVNIGNQPTLPSGHVTVEAHVLDDNPELYGKYVRLRLIRRMRAEKRFENIEALTDQLARDREEALKYFHMA